METSPYLLQHAHNPVDWYPWGAEALQRALVEDKPILVSIGYSACHWCHVMERESFEDEHIAAIMNRHFINIKVDREERPDLDHIYMDALQTLSGSGGWPLNMFLTPDAKPFYGGTYLPPRPAHNRPSWEQVLVGINSAWEDKRSDIINQAEQLMAHLRNANHFGMQSPTSFEIPFEERFARQHTRLIAENLLKSADLEWGGFGRAPKFPQTFSIQFLLRYHQHTGDEAVLEHALHSLRCMIRGGIHDHIGGGFARYSTDREWLVPHFEKMAYDNALLVTILFDAWQLTGENIFREAAEGILSFVLRELTGVEGGFFSALDADSEDVEGKFYTWSLDEVRQVLGEDAELFSDVYDITEVGNWEHTNIPRLHLDIIAYAREKSIDAGQLSAKMADCREKLLERRSHRLRPLLDDKMLLGWNALMNMAFTRAYAATGDEKYLIVATRNISFLLNAFRSPEGTFYHTWKGQGRFPAFLDDMASLIRALINLQEITGDGNLLLEAGGLVESVIRDFQDQDSGYFFYTPAQQQDIIFRKKEVYDGAVPSGNALMAKNLHDLGILLGKEEWKTLGIKMVDGLHETVTRYPSSFGVWADFLQDLAEGVLELVVTGPDALRKGRELLHKKLIYNKVIQTAKISDIRFPLLENRVSENHTRYFLCKDYACRIPSETLEEFIQLIELEMKR